MSPRRVARNLREGGDDCPTEMDAMDDRSIDRLFGATLRPEDAPAGYGGVVTLLRDARTEARSISSDRGDETVAAMVAAIRANPPGGERGGSVGRRRRSRLAAGLAAGFLTVFGSLTAAGALPSAAQNGVSTVLAKVGIDVPRGGGADATTEDGGNPNGNSNGDPNGANPHSDADPATNHGECVSNVAGSGGEVVSGVAQSDCGKDPREPQPGDPGGGNGNTGAPPGLEQEKTPPTHPPQSHSGGSGGSSNASPNADAHSNANGGSGGDSPASAGKPPK